jgi:hypothetical protein
MTVANSSLTYYSNKRNGRKRRNKKKGKENEERSKKNELRKVRSRRKKNRKKNIAKDRKVKENLNISNLQNSEKKIELPETKSDSEQSDCDSLFSHLPERVLFENEYLSKDLPDDTVLPLGVIIPSNYELDNWYILYKN